MNDWEWEIAAEAFAVSEEGVQARQSSSTLVEQPKYSKPVLPQNQCFRVAGKLLCCFSLSSCLIPFPKVQVQFGCHTHVRLPSS